MDDTDEVEYIATYDEDTRKFFSLVILSESAMSDEEYAAALIAFAHDIREGNFSFDTAKSESLS